MYKIGLLQGACESSNFLKCLRKEKKNQLKPVGIVIQSIFENQSEKTCT